MTWRRRPTWMVLHIVVFVLTPLALAGVTVVCHNKSVRWDFFTVFETSCGSERKDVRPLLRSVKETLLQGVD